jgi:branched-chain amino acid transport system permease protein
LAVNKPNIALKLIPFALLLTVFIIVPLNISSYYVDVFTMFLINVVLAFSYRFVVNAGDYSFAHIPLMGMGSFAAGIVATRFGLPFWAGILIGPIIAAISGFIISIPLMRTKGFYFFTASYVIGQVVTLIWVKLDLFGRFTGIRYMPTAKIFGIGLGNLTNFYFVTLILTLITMVILYQLENSRIGMTIKSVPMNDKLSQSLGINLYRYRTLAFVVGSFFAGLAGALLAYRLGSVNPTTFSTSYGLYLVVWVVFGGLKSFMGPFWGTLVLTIINTAVLKMSDLEFITPIFYGVILIVTLLYVPAGLAGLPKRILEIFKRKKKTINS